MDTYMEALPIVRMRLKMSGSSHLAGVVRGLLFLAAVAAPLLVLASLGGSSERARHLSCVERAIAARPQPTGSPLVACYGE